MTVRPGQNYIIYGQQGMNVAIPDYKLYVTVEDIPAPDGTVLVSFNMMVRVPVAALSDR